MRQAGRLEEEDGEVKTKDRAPSAVEKELEFAINTAEEDKAIAGSSPSTAENGDENENGAENGNEEEVEESTEKHVDWVLHDCITNSDWLMSYRV